MNMKLSVFAFTLFASISYAAPASPDPLSPITILTNYTTPSQSASIVLGSLVDSLVTTINGVISSVIDPPDTLSMSPPKTTSAIVTTPPTTTTDTATDTVTYFITGSPTTITVSAPTSTVTDVVTVIPAPPTTSSALTQASKVTWAAPSMMTDLAAFNVSAFPGGQHNLQIVNGIPASASATTPAANAIVTNPADLLAIALTTWDNSSSALRLLYPQDSIDPAKKPQGGAEFYATPIPLHSANNVSFEYSVFFPVDYDWVLGGKLPGLYGGHTGCSGGNNALTCFSTRLMWRPNGMGELYLYAPKSKQTKALCSDPHSVCDATYGFSIGRGSFRYAAGGWTHLRQIVSLNTPGKQNGIFILDVNGNRVINRSDVFYRDVPQAAKAEKPQPTGILGPLLGGLSQLLDPRNDRNIGPLPLPPSPTSQPLLTNINSSLPVPAPQFSQNLIATTIIVSTSPVVVFAPASTVTAVLFAVDDEDKSMAIVSTPTEPIPQPIGFSGIFFSTFFGGHEAEYATPKDQHAWFRDFAMSAE